MASARITCRRTIAALICALLPWIAACADTKLPTAPTATPAPAAPPASAVRRIYGYLLDTTWRKLPGALVEVLDGPSAGTALSPGPSGQFFLPGQFSGTTRFRATAEGHEPMIITWVCQTENCSGDTAPCLCFTLRPTAAPIVDLAGDYLFSYIAAPSCASLPPDARTRTYRASLVPRIRPDNGYQVGFTLVFDSPSVMPHVRQRLQVGIARDYIASYFEYEDVDIPGLVEDIGDNRYVGVYGLMSGTIAGSAATRFTASLDGTISYVAAPGPPAPRFVFPSPNDGAHCSARDHQMVFERR